MQLRSDKELDKFADDLKKLALKRNRSQGWWYARVVFEVLGNAASRNPEKRGIPYERGLEMLIEIYEAYETLGDLNDHPIRYILPRILEAGGENYLIHLLEEGLINAMLFANPVQNGFSGASDVRFWSEFW